MTIGVEFASRIIEIDSDTNVKLQIWDTAGQESFRSVTRSYYRGSIACILCYDITRPRSFQNCKKWLEDIQQYSYPKIMIVLIGNKADLEDKRKVSFEEGQAYAQANDMIFFETSAYENEGVEKCFLKAAKEIYRGVVTMKYEIDMDGDIPGVKEGNAELNASMRHKYMASGPDLSSSYRSASKRTTSAKN